MTIWEYRLLCLSNTHLFKWEVTDCCFCCSASLEFLGKTSFTDYSASCSKYECYLITFFFLWVIRDVKLILKDWIRDSVKKGRSSYALLYIMCLTLCYKAFCHSDLRILSYWRELFHTRQWHFFLSFLQTVTFRTLFQTT